MKIGTDNHDDDDDDDADDGSVSHMFMLYICCRFHYLEDEDWDG